MIQRIKVISVCAWLKTSLGWRAEFRAALCRGGSPFQAGVRPARPHGGARGRGLLSGERYANPSIAAASRS